jgi:cell division septation protein DedD
MVKKSRLLVGSVVIVAVAAVSLVLAFGGVLTASGASSGGKVIVPSPPGQPTLAPTITTKTTTRIYGENPYEVAVSVTQHIWPAVLPGSAQSVPDRPRAVTLLTPDDPLTAITATPIVHFPDDAPPLYVTRSGIPEVVLAEIKRLGPVGIDRFNNVQAFLFGGAANAAVKSQLTAIGIKWFEVTAPTIPALANKVDALYGSITNPDTGVAQMANGAMTVMIGSLDAYPFVLPATHWVTHMPTALQWVRKNSVPPATIDALVRRLGDAMIYLFGGPNQISSSVARQLDKYGNVQRITNDDVVAYNTPPPDDPVQTAIAFNKMWDSAGMVGWKMTGPGHGFTLVRLDDWQGAVASSPLSHLGFHAPLLFTTSSTQLPDIVDAYYKAVAPTFLTTPADGPYNMTYVIGSWDQISWPLQAHVDNDSEMANRRDVAVNTGSRYSDSQP